MSRRRGRSRRALAGALLAGGLLAAGLLAGCRGEPASPTAETPAPEDRVLLILCELDEAAVGELLAAWSAATGFAVEVRYGAPGELAAAALVAPAPTAPTLLLSRHAPSLGALAAAGRALPLPADLVAPVDPLFVDAERRWVGLSGRARVVVHDPQRVAREALPTDLAAFGDPAHRGRFGLAPATRSFRIHLAAYRALHGPEALDRLLARLAANEPVLAADGEELVRAVLDHEIDFALVDHADLERVRAERGVETGAAVALPAADSSGYLDLAGAAVLAESPAAFALLRHLLGPDAQLRLAAATAEYPVRRGTAPADPLLPLADLDLAQIDYRAVAAALPETEAAIDASALSP